MLTESKFAGPSKDNKENMTNKDKQPFTSPILKEAGLDTLPFNLEVQKILRGILRHIPLILIFTFLFTAIGAYYSYRLAHTYTAQSVLIYSQETSKGTDERYQILHITLSSAVDMITLPVHLKAVKSILGLDLSLEDLKKMITVSIPARESNLISINVTAKNPNLAIDIANTLAQVVVKSTEEMNLKQWQTAYAFFKNQETALRQKLEAQTKEFADFRKEHRFMGMDIGSSSSIERLRSAEAKLDTANLDYTRLLVEYENISREFSKIPDRLSKAAAENTILKSRLIQLESALIDARSKYAPGNPKIKALEQQIEDLKKSAENSPTNPQVANDQSLSTEPNPLKEKLNLDLISMQAKLRASQKLKEDLAEMVANYKQEVSNWSEEQSTFAKLLDKKNSLDYQIRSNEQTQRMMEVMLNLGKGDLETYQPAEKAFSSENSIWVELIPTLAFIFGSLFGIAAAVVAEVLDKKIRTSKQLTIAYHLPCIATIPEWHLLLRKNAEKKTLFYTRNIAERLHLMGPFSSVAVVSSIAGEGKSTIAYHLALYYANLGKKTLLLEFDSRPNPFADETTLAPSSLEQFLQGEASIEDIIYHNAPDRLKAGDHPEMKELVKSESMKKLWDALRQSYEIIILDVPGIIEDEFAINVTGIADQCLFVVGSSKVNKNYVDASLKEFEIHGIKPSGIILNRVLPIYEDNLRASAYDKQTRSKFLGNLFKRKSSD